MSAVEKSVRKYARRVAWKAVRSFAQALAAILTASGAGLLDADWQGALSAAGMAGFLAILMNIEDPTNDPIEVQLAELEQAFLKNPPAWLVAREAKLQERLQVLGASPDYEKFTRAADVSLPGMPEPGHRAP